MDSSTDISVSQVSVFYYLNREFVFVDLTVSFSTSAVASERTGSLHVVFLLNALKTRLSRVLLGL